MRKIHNRTGVTAILAVVALSNLCHGQATAPAAAAARVSDFVSSVKCYRLRKSIPATFAQAAAILTPE